MSDQPTEVVQPVADPGTPPPPAEASVDLTKFEEVTVTVTREPEGRYGPGWYVKIFPGGVEWILSWRKLGGFDQDLQELATPGFKEALAERYARETGRQRTEPGPGAKQ